MGDLNKFLSKEAIPQVHSRFPFRSILTELQCLHGKAFVVGGAVRDTLLSKPINDIDIVVFGKPLNNREIYFDKGLTKYSTQRISDYLSTHRFEGTMQGYSVDLFFRDDCENIQSFMKSFDIGLCCVAYDGNITYVTDDFYTDIINKTLTLRKAEFATNKHLLKLIAKYPDYKVVR